MRTMARLGVLVLVVAFFAGVWDTRYGQERRPGSPAPFRTEPVERSRLARPAPELASVEAVEGKGYDRVLFTFRGALPGYQVRYVPEVADQAGRPLPLRGRAFLAVTFDPARAHDPGGAPTVSTATLTPGSPVLRQVRFAGDLEGRVSFGLGLAGRDGFRVSELRGPARVAVDVR
jgi:hypothetical protein